MADPPRPPPTRRALLASLGINAAAVATGRAAHGQTAPGQAAPGGAAPGGAAPGGAASGGSAADQVAPGQALPGSAEPPTLRFPPGFAWGVAASAPQTEGSAGRGRSIWDEFAARPGAIKDGSDLSIGTGWESSYSDDLALVAAAGFTAFRFSVAWPRVQPDGVGPANPAGLDLYDRMVDAMLARRIQPWMTLFHWDLPAALPGGWLNRDTASRFAEYAGIVGRRLGDRVRSVIVLNEPGVVAVLGHALGRHAPGLQSRAAFAAAVHHQNLAYGLGVQALRAAMPPGVRIGTSLSLQPSHPAAPGPDAAEAARIWDDAWNQAYLDPIYGHPYPTRFAADLAPFLRDGDLRVIAARPDFLGVNYYSRMHMVPAPGTVLGATWGAAPQGTPATGLDWPVEPDGLIEQLRALRDGYGNPELVITENGAAYADPPEAARPDPGPIADPDRITFLRGHLRALAAAAAEGCRVAGYFAWTLTDNFEWGEGYTAAFGLVRVDRATLRRTPRLSLSWLGARARANAPD